MADWRNKLERLKGQRDVLEKNIKRSRSRIKTLKKKHQCAKEAQRYIQTAAKSTQEFLQFHLTDIATLAMSSVFPQPYTMYLDFIPKRGRSEATLSFGRSGSDERLNPMKSSGGGPVDVASFALRVALWFLHQPQRRNVLILDEPFRFVSRGLREKTSTMLKELSQKLQIQVIMVTHDSSLVECADRVIHVKKKDGVSQVRIGGQ